MGLHLMGDKAGRVANHEARPDDIQLEGIGASKDTLLKVRRTSKI